MSYNLEEALASLPENGEVRTIGNYSVRKKEGFLHFTPSISYQGQTISRLKIRRSTFKNMGSHTLDILFAQIFPNLDGKSYEELPDESGEHPPAAVLFSTTVLHIHSNYDVRKDREYHPIKQYRHHLNRVLTDAHGGYLDWPHCSPIHKNKYVRDKEKQSKEIPPN